jgi:hypothetical protein
MFRTLTVALVLCFVYTGTSLAGWFSSEPLIREITSAPDGAKIYYSQKADDKGTLLGTTPFTDKFNREQFPAGYYRLEKEGFKTQTQRIQPPGDNPQNIKIAKPLSPVTTIKLSVASNPPDATIFFGVDKNDIGKKLGNTPYNDTRNDANSEEKPYWEKGFYKAVLAGYKPEVIAIQKMEQDLELSFDLVKIPPMPNPPRMEYPDASQVAYKPVAVDALKLPGTEISPITRILVAAFREAAGKDVAAVMEDNLILKLQRKGYVVEEREIAEKAINDVSGGRKIASPVEIMKPLSDALKSRYFVVGSITEFSFGKEEIAVPPVIPEQEKERYLKEYNAYLKYYQADNSAPPQPVKTVKEWEQEYAAKTKSATLPVARLGISAKMLDVKTGKAVWTGVIGVSESSVQKAVTGVVDAMVESIAQ